MADSIPWISFAILALLVIFAVIFVVMRKYRGKKQPVDYYTLFLMGIVWMAIGLIPDNYTFFAIGVVFFLVGLVHKSEWKKNRKNWTDMTKDHRTVTLIIVAVLLAMAIAGLIAFLLSA